IKKREEITLKYRENLKEVDGLKLLEDKEGIKHNYSYLPILIDEEKFGLNRDTLFQKLQEYNIFTRKYFYPLVVDFDCYKDIYSGLELENAKYVANRVLTLPIYGELELVKVDYICEAIKEIVKKYGVFK
ncbi:MAG: DegT/DnrJ/EryC1/StrS family aminotransferase, partial [Cetobacterium sp.]